MSNRNYTDGLSCLNDALDVDMYVGDAAHSVELIDVAQTHALLGICEAVEHAVQQLDRIGKLLDRRLK